MSVALKEALHSLIESLPTEELPAARRYLEYLRDQGSDPYASFDTDDGLDDEEREQLHASIERGLDQMKSGRGRPAAEALADLRSRD